MDKIIGIKSISGKAFYGGIHKDGTISQNAIIFNDNIFQRGILEYLAFETRTDNFTKPYIIELLNVKKKFKITVEEI